MPVNEEKYIVFKRETLIQLFGELALPRGDVDCAPVAEHILERIAEEQLPDAVVIRRQDSFASPCLLTYAAMISMVAEHHPERKVAEELLAIADYFHHQGVLAGEEGYKLPTL